MCYIYFIYRMYLYIRCDIRYVLFHCSAYGRKLYLLILFILKLILFIYLDIWILKSQRGCKNKYKGDGYHYSGCHRLYGADTADGSD